MPNPVLRVLLVISVLIAALAMAGVGAGLANADPDDPDSPPGTDAVVDTPVSSEPQPTTGLPTGPPTEPAQTPVSIFDIPRTIALQLRDMFGRPLSLFGNGRVPGTLTEPDAATPIMTTGGKRDKPPPKAERKPAVTPPEPIESAATTPERPRKPSSSVDIALPFAPPISVAVPSIPVPGYESTRWSLNLTDPLAAYTSVGQTLTTVNSLLSDAFASCNPSPQPKPAPPEPALRTFEEEPSVVESDGTGGVSPLSSGSDLPVLQAPVVVPQIRGAVPRPVTGTVPADVPARALGAGSAGAPAVTPQASVAPPNMPPAQRPPPQASPAAMGTPAPREWYPRYPGSARTSRVATVALPGLAGLIAITAGGGVIGYRQANSGRYLRSEAARFLQ